MIDDNCASICYHSKLKVAENGRSASFYNDSDPRLTCVKVDGCLEFDGPRCDYVVEKGEAAIFVELKGKNVEHGAGQVIATAAHWRQAGRVARFAGLIVARQYPKASASIQLKQQAFARSFRGPLHVVTSNQEYTFENVLSFKGPLKGG